MTTTNINDVLDGHIGLELDCVDRPHLNSYVPNLQVSGQVVSFFTAHSGDPVPSPALMQKMGNRFRADVPHMVEFAVVPARAVWLCGTRTPAGTPGRRRWRLGRCHRFATRRSRRRNRRLVRPLLGPHSLGHRSVGRGAASPDRRQLNRCLGDLPRAERHSRLAQLMTLVLAPSPARGAVERGLARLSAEAL